MQIRACDIDRAHLLAATTWILSAPLLVALDAHAHRATQIHDPGEVVQDVSDFLVAMSDELGRFSTIRLGAIRDLRGSGASYDRIAAITGLSKARVAQLSTTAWPRTDER